MKLIIDVNLSTRWAALLTEVGIEALHWASIGQSDAADTEIMSFASAHGYAVLTNDLDFGAILAATHATRPSVIQIRIGDVRPEVAGDFIVRILAKAQGSIEKGALVTVKGARTRIHMLPL